MASTSNSNAVIPKFAEFVRQRCFFKESTKLVVNMASATANVIISSYRRRGRARDALGFLEVALRGGMKPDMATLSAVLSACSALQNLSNGLQFHALAAKLGFTNDMFVGSSLVDFYAKTGKLNLARQVFDEIPKRNVVLWNAMLAGYARAGKMKDARHVFEEMPERDMVSCTALISGYARHGLFKDALNIFSEMLRDGVGVDEFAICSVVSACGSGGGGCIVLEQGKQVHALAVKSGFVSFVSVNNALITMYSNGGFLECAFLVFENMSIRDSFSWTAMLAGCAKLGDLQKARHLFDNMPNRNIISWNAMIAAYAHDGPVQQCLMLYIRLLRGNTGALEADRVTFTSIVAACAGLGDLDCARHVHAHVIRSGFQSAVSVGNALVSMYAKCGDIQAALNIFESIDKDSVSWNAMITGYAFHGFYEEALQLFQQAKRDRGVQLDVYVFSSVLSSCGHLTLLQLGKSVHGQAIASGFDSHVSVSNAAIAMYAKCGSLNEAFQLFDNMAERQRDVVTWNAVFAACAQHGRGKDVLALFEKMQSSGMVPDELTFISVLSACNHSGLVDKGLQLFTSMSQKFGITPNSLHYACIIDILGRDGRLEEASRLIDSIPFDADANAWSALLGASKKHSNIPLAKLAAEALFKLEPYNAAKYVLLSNLYAESGNWEEAEKVRRMMVDRKVKKQQPGCSWLEVKNKVHRFVAHDRSHPQTEEIYAKLQALSREAEALGYIPSTDFDLHDVEVEQKENCLLYHSERIAIAFGLISLPPSLPIIVYKNLRVCGDCHVAIKYISRIVKREITLRDINRFHHFKDGFCSCGDYW